MAESAPGVTPFAETAIFRLGLAPLEVIAIFPLMAPAVVGANCTERVVLWPALRVRGSATPLRLNPAPVAVAAEIVKLVPPELVRDSVSVFELPTATFPKVRLVGLGVIWACVTPLAVRPMFSGEPGASETTARFPLAEPAAVGANATVNDTLWFGATVAGSVNPLTE